MQSPTPEQIQELAPAVHAVFLGLGYIVLLFVLFTVARSIRAERTHQQRLKASGVEQFNPKTKRWEKARPRRRTPSKGTK